MHKRWVFKLSFLFLFFSFSIMALNYIVDPFQHYRIASWYKITSKKQREVTPGLAKNFDYQTVVLGSSMAENFEASFINKILDTRSLKLCMSAMTAYEMRSLLEVILSNNKKLDTVILALDLYAFTGKETRIRTDKQPTYLYDNNPLTDIFYLLNKETLRFSFRMLSKERGKASDFDKMWYWGNAYNFSKETVLSTYHKHSFNSSFKNSEYTKEIFIRNFNYNLLHLIRDNPKVNFIIFYPPYSYLTYKDMQDKQWLQEAISFKKYIFDLGLDNLEVYDFQCLNEVTENLDNYRDITHYSADINKLIINAIKNKKHLTTQDNINTCLHQMQKSANKVTQESSNLKHSKIPLLKIED